MLSSDGNSIFYTNSSDGSKLYKKGINESGNGTAITTFPIYHQPILSKDNSYIIYINTNDWDKLYKKSLSDGTIWTPINTVWSIKPTLFPDGKHIIYTNKSDGYRLYKKNIDDTLNGIAVSPIQSYDPMFSPSGENIFYTNHNDDGKLYKITLPRIWDLQSVDAENYDAVAFNVTGVYFSWKWELTYSYSFDGINFMPLQNPQTIGQQNVTYSFDLDVSSQEDGDITIHLQANDGSFDTNTLNATITKESQQAEMRAHSTAQTQHTFSLDLSSQPDGVVSFYAKVNDGENDSNIASIVLPKDTYFLQAPESLIATDITSDSARYTWEDTVHWEYQEDGFVIKDETGNIVIDNIAKNIEAIEEAGLEYATLYKRQVCSINDQWEECSELISFVTPYPDPTIQEVEMYIGWQSIYLPRDIENYDVTTNNNNLFESIYWVRNELILR